MATFTTPLRGITHTIYQSLMDAAPQLLQQGQNIDEYLLNQLKSRLIQELNAGSSNLAIEVLLEHCFEEIKQTIDENITKKYNNVPMNLQTIDKPVALARP